MKIIIWGHYPLHSSTHGYIHDTYYKAFKGILLLDDIHKSKEMKSFWNTFDEENKVDVTAVGHQSGTGLVEFES